MSTQNYVVGRGRLYFDRFPEGLLVGTGLKYFGSTSDLKSTRAATALDHYDSEAGLKVKDMSVTLQDDITYTFTVDNVNADNIALWFGGAKTTDTLSVADAADKTETFKVFGGNYYQIGKSLAIQGVRNLMSVAVEDGGTPAATDGSEFTVDLETGLLFIVPGGGLDVANGKDITVTFKRAAATRDVVITQGQTIYGALTFASENPVGSQNDHFVPFVKLTSSGDYTLKGDTWQAMTFTAEAMKKPDGTAERVYITSRA